MIAPLTDQVGETRETKVTRAAGTKHNKSVLLDQHTLAKEVTLAYSGYREVWPRSSILYRNEIQTRLVCVWLCPPERRKGGGEQAEASHGLSRCHRKRKDYHLK